MASLIRLPIEMRVVAERFRGIAPAIPVPDGVNASKFVAFDSERRGQPNSSSVAGRPVNTSPLIGLIWPKIGCASLA